MRILCPDPYLEFSVDIKSKHGSWLVEKNLTKNELPYHEARKIYQYKPVVYEKHEQALSLLINIQYYTHLIFKNYEFQILTPMTQTSSICS